MAIPRVIIGDIEIQYIEGETPRGKKPEYKTKTFIRESITVMEDLQCIPDILIPQYMNRFENQIKENSSKKITVTDIVLINFHADFCVVNYTPKEGWN